MSTSVIPALIDAVIAEAKTSLADVEVYDGYGISDDPGDYLMVGVEDPNSTGEAHSAESVQEWANANYTARNETGEIVCVATSWNGDGDTKAARDSVYATVARVENFLRADPSLGVDGVLWTGFGSRHQFSQNEDSSGAIAFVVFAIHFRARI